MFLIVFEEWIGVGFFIVFALWGISSGSRMSDCPTLFKFYEGIVYISFLTMLDYVTTV